MVFHTTAPNRTVNETANVTCGDGTCSLTEFCWQDCKSKNIKTVAITTLAISAAAAIVHIHKKPQKIRIKKDLYIIKK